MNTLDLKTLVRLAKNGSSFYAELYRDLPPDFILEDLPLIAQEEYWEAAKTENNRILTSRQADGIVYTSGGTTGAPKYTCFSRTDIGTMMDFTSIAMMRSGLTSGDRIANYFHAGNMYASFACAHDYLGNVPVGVVVYPIAYVTPVPEAVQLIIRHGINAILLLPSSAIQIFDHVKQTGIKNFPISKLFYAGEAFYEDQRKMVREAAPGIQIHSAFYGSVDGGIIGFCDPTCGFNEHRAYDDAAIMEIVDEDTGEVIHETDKEGKIVVTALYRTLMPVIRYPSGDLGMWKEPEGTPNRKFMLLGRANEGARISHFFLRYNDMMTVFHNLRDQLTVFDFQIVVEHSDEKDHLTLNVALDKGDASGEMKEIIIQGMFRQFDEWNMRSSGAIPGINFVRKEDLEYNPRTGKLKRVIDLRLKK
jgi:phenylacetate-CoA ligase